LLEPGPVVLLTTARKGHANVMTMSWHMMVEFEPPLVACVVSGADYSFAALCATKQCVIAIPGSKLAPLDEDVTLEVTDGLGARYRLLTDADLPRPAGSVRARERPLRSRR
jgi:Flavin reductase like domain